MPNDVPDWTNASILPQTILGTLSTTAGGPTQNATYTLPVGTQCIGYLVHLDGSNGDPASVSMTGHQSAQQYVLANTSTGFLGAQWVEAMAGDTSVDVQVVANASVPSKVDLLVTPLVPAVAVRSQQGRAVPVTFLGSPAPWQAALANPLVVNGTLASLAIVALVSGVGGLTVYLHGCTIGPDATAGTTIELQDSAGGALMDATMNLARQTSMGFAGAPLNVGRGVQMQNTGPVSGSPRGGLTYSIQ